MDPKQPAQLDPKLQEAYDRVMGLALEQPHSSTQPTATPQQSTPITPVQPAASPNVEPTPSAQPIPTVSQQTPEMPTTQTTAPLPPQNPSQLPQMSASALMPWLRLLQHLSTKKCTRLLQKKVPTSRYHQ